MARKLQPDANLGLPSHDNWLAFGKAKALQSIETPFFSDIDFVGPDVVDLGPYRIFNARPLREDRQLVPVLFLRHSLHSVRDSGGAKLAVQAYHGGGIADELCALLSLVFGARLRCGGSTRRFRPDGDPLGEPFASRYHENPILGPSSADGPIFPDALGERDLKDAEFLATFPTLAPAAASALVKAARQYQHAIGWRNRNLTSRGSSWYPPWKPPRSITSVVIMRRLKGCARRFLRCTRSLHDGAAQLSWTRWRR